MSTSYFFAKFPFQRSLFIAISKHYNTDQVIEELVSMGWKDDFVSPKVVKKSIEELKTVLLEDI